MSTSVPISQLNLIGNITSSDYLPVVQNNSTTTFRTTFDTVAHWISSSVQASSSISSVSASNAISSSYSKVGGSSSFALNLVFPNTSTASAAISASHANQSDNARSSSTAISASWAPIQGITAFSISASWSSASLFSTSASFASSSKTSVSSSWASQSLSSSNSTTASFALKSITSSFAQTASFVINAATNFSYPYIQQIHFWARHDDWVDVNFLGAQWTSPGQGMCMGWENSGGTPYEHFFTWDDVNKVYTGGTRFSPIASTPLKLIRMWVDNRGGAGHNWFFSGNITASFALSPTVTVTHIYTPTAATNYAGTITVVSADRAAAGLNAILNEYTTVPVFPVTIL